MGGGHSSSSDSKAEQRPPAQREFRSVYLWEKDVGSGSFSVVGKVISLEDQQVYAAKVIQKNLLCDEDLANLEREIEILKLLKHPRVLRMVEHFEDDCECVIITEFLTGGELFERIVTKSHYTEQKAREHFKSLLEVIAYLHDMGIVHRDLKPENLMLTSDSEDALIKIVDFGAAFQMAKWNGGQNENICGSPSYIAPEILTRQPYGCEVDIWSMGVILYILLSGYPPFQVDDMKELFKRIVAGSYSFPENHWGKISQDAKDIISHMLCVDQSKRWTARELLRHKWFGADEENLNEKDLTVSLRRYVSASKLVSESSFRSLLSERNSPRPVVNIASLGFEK